MQNIGLGRIFDLKLVRYGQTISAKAVTSIPMFNIGCFWIGIPDIELELILFR
ncbi:hypothetical protein D3C81_2292590 [compost metagenome]